MYMSLLNKIQDKLKGKKVVNPTNHSKKTSQSLSNLPNNEKLKVLDYLNSIKDLHKENEQ